MNPNSDGGVKCIFEITSQLCAVGTEQHNQNMKETV